MIATPTPPPSAWDDIEARLLRRVEDRLGRFAAADAAEQQRFIDWAIRGGFIADREPVNFEEWRYLRPLYEAVPEDCTDLDMVIMKPSQAGASIFAMLFVLWLALRGRYRIGYYLPTDTYAQRFSDTRFIRMVRDNKSINEMAGDATVRGVAGTREGSMHVRKFGFSLVIFSSIEGIIATEAEPLDATVKDEVQEMSGTAMERLRERLSGSKLKASLSLSTANFDGADIHALYQQTDQREFFTRCGCRDGVALADCWDPRSGPLCIDEGNGTTPSVPQEPFFYCPRCREIIRDPQDGAFRALVPENRRVGFHWSQMLSPRQTPASILEKWQTRVDVKNFYNRVLGRPFTDPKQQPVTEAQLTAAQNERLEWGRQEADAVENYFMGLDQMGHDIHAIIVAKMRATRKVRLVHLEIVQADNPWLRAGALMEEYRVRVCLVEANPNFNEAHRFAKEFNERVFVINYFDLKDDVVLWGDRPREKVTVRRTEDEAKTQWTATIDQYKAMALALGKWGAHEVETPDARKLVQHLRTDRGFRPVQVCRDVLWLHLQRVALVTEHREGKKAELERKLRRAVRKVGIDPHFAYSWMLAMVAWVRIYGTAQLLEVESHADAVRAMTVGKPVSSKPIDQVKAAMPQNFVAPHEMMQRCGGCENFDPHAPQAPAGFGYCKWRNFWVQAKDPGCEYYLTKLEEEGSAP